MTIEERLNRQFDEATISNNFIFTKTMEAYPDICRRLIEKILHVKIARINYPEREKIIEERIDCKGVRLDVYVEDDANRMFNLEMQVAREDDLARRIRYYQGLLDLNALKRGAKYELLRESYIVFICLFDYFRHGKHVYTFRQRCDEDLSLLLGDGTTKVFLNTEGVLDDADADIKNFLDYVARGTIADDFIRELHEAVCDVKSGRKVRREYMTFELLLEERMKQARAEGRAEGHAEGHAEGRAEGRLETLIETAKKMLSLSMPLRDIIAVTGWSKEKILQLAADTKSKEDS